MLRNQFDIHLLGVEDQEEISFIVKLCATKGLKVALAIDLLFFLKDSWLIYQQLFNTPYDKRELISLFKGEVFLLTRLTMLIPTLAGLGGFGCWVMSRMIRGAVKTVNNLVSNNGKQAFYTEFVNKFPKYILPEEVEEQTIQCPLLFAKSNEPVCISFMYQGRWYQSVYDYEAIKAWLNKQSLDPKSNIDLLHSGVSDFSLSFKIPEELLLEPVKKLELEEESNRTGPRRKYM